MTTINIGKQFSDTPLGRYPSDSPFSGERFREEILRPAFERGEDITVQIDDAEGYGSSFLDEAFGGLVRKGYLTAPQLRTRLVIESADPGFSIYKKLIWKYISEAKFEKDQSER